MGVSQKAFNYNQRKRIQKMSMKERMEAQANADKPPPTRDEVKCEKCGFKAKYQFVRCPECNEVQK